MNKTALLIIAIIMFAACNNAETTQGTDTAGVPSALDTMPVLHPGRVDSSGVIKTPLTNDNNAIMPDSAVKNR